MIKMIQIKTFYRKYLKIDKHIKFKKKLMENT